MGSTASAAFEVIPGEPLDFMRDFDLAVLGYEEAEYLVTGTASSYEIEGERGEDGRWAVTPAPEAPFRTRIIVRKPSDPAASAASSSWSGTTSPPASTPRRTGASSTARDRGRPRLRRVSRRRRPASTAGAFAEGIHLKLLDPGRV